MVQITNLDTETLQKIPNVIELLYEIFGAKTIALFAVVVNNELGFIGRDGGNCVYIHKDGYNNFTLDQNEDLGALRKDGLEIFFGNDIFFVDENKIEQHVELHSLSEPDEENFDGFVSYKQYNPANDTLCEMRFQHMYRETDGKPIIYGYHTEKIDCLYIDEEYTKKPRPTKGILPKRAKYYKKIEFDDDMIGYKVSLLREYGLVEFLEKGPYKLDKERKIIRYVKTKLIDLEGNYRDFWPFGEQIKTEELLEVVKSYGFRTELPWQFIEIYNGRDKLVNTIQEIVKQMKEVSKKAKENGETDKVAILTFKN